MLRITFAVALSLVPSFSSDGAIGRSEKHRRPAHRAQRKTGVVIDAAAVSNPALAQVVGPGSSGSAVLRAQILLARAHFSCGEIDARYGANLRGAIADFQTAHGLAGSGIVEEETWRILNADTAPALFRAAIAPEEVAGPFTPVPEDMIEKAKLPALSYSSPLEAIAEKYHASPALLQKLNPGSGFDRAGEEILAPNVLVPPPEKAASIVVSKSRHSVTALDAEGRVLSRFPATSGSEHDPLPIGKWKILGVGRNPSFHYNPDLFWDAKGSDGKALIAPGPNNPVGVAWIDLSKEHYGIHGTPEPSQIGKTQSHGCVRLTNWDVTELSNMVGPGTPAILEE
ncbi:MAG TPA: L,D-transpeptidase [Thermoanaerobaculia bacterium]